MCSPPPRDKANQEVIWRGIETGVFEVFSSDHAGYRYDDPEGKMKHGRNAPFKKVANGVPGLEVRTALLFSEGVGKGRHRSSAFVALTATNAAKLYGLHPRKGTIAVGSDADLAIWDPDKEVTISQSMIHDAMDYTPYEGMKIKGWPITTLVRGEVGRPCGRVRRERRQGSVPEVRYLASKSPARAAGHRDSIRRRDRCRQPRNVERVGPSPKATISAQSKRRPPPHRSRRAAPRPNAAGCDAQ